MKKLNIAYIVSHTKYSPQWEWFLNEIKKDVNIYFIIIDNDYRNQLYENLKQSGINLKILVSNNFVSHLFSIFKVLFYLIINKINIVQTEMPLGNLIGISSALISRKKRIMTASNINWYKDFNSKKQYFIDKFSYYFSNIIICQADTSKELLIKDFNIPESKLKIIYHAIDKNKYLETNQYEMNLLKKKYSITQNDFVFGMIARLEYWKGHIYPIMATKLILNEFPNIKLLIFGEGPEKENLEKLIKQLDLSNNVFLCGFEKQIINLYKIFDVQIHVPIDPYCETFGITIIDGMMSKLPLILTKSGIANSIAQHLFNSWVVPFKDEKAIAFAMKELIISKSLRVKLGENAQQTVIDKFSLHNKVNSHLNLYNNVN